MTNFSLDKCLAAQSMVSVEHLRSLLDYDPDSGFLFWKKRNNRNFNSKYAGTIAGAKHAAGAIQIQISVGDWKRLFWAHRIAWAHFHGSWPCDLIDHRDGNPTNNRIVNLRLADGNQNSANRHDLRGSVPFRGVYRWKDGRFAAQIKSDRKWRWLGLHSDAIAAAQAYDNAATELHGEFAVTNSSLGLYRHCEVQELL